MECVFQAFWMTLNSRAKSTSFETSWAQLPSGLDLVAILNLALANSPSHRPKLISNYDIRWTDHYFAKRYERRSHHSPFSTIS